MLDRLILFLGFNLWMFAGWYFWLSSRRWPLLDTLVGTFLLQCAQILATEMIAAAIGALRFENILTLNLIISGIIWGISIKGLPEEIRWTVVQIRSIIKEMNGWAWVMAGLLGIVWAYTFWISVHKPATGWDTYMYHLPIAAFRMQEGNLQRIRSAWTFIEGYPKTGEMLMLWSLLFLHTQDMIDASQWPFWVFGTLALMSLATRWGAKMSYTIAGSLVWALAPVTILQAQEGYLDLIVGALFWMGLCLAFRPPSVESLSLVGISAGMLLGIKFGTLSLIAFLIGLSIWLAFQARLNRQVWLPALCISLIYSVLIGGYWYWENYLYTRNPIWPLGLSIGPFQLKGPFTLSGYAQWYTPEVLRNRPAPEQWWIVWKETESYYTWDSKLTGFGPLWFVIGLPSIIMWLIIDRKSIFISFVFGALLMIQPLSWHTRYVLFLPGLGSLALSSVMNRISRFGRIVIQILLVGGILFSFAVAFDVYAFKYMWIPYKYKTTPVYGAWPPAAGAYRFLDANAWGSNAVTYGGTIAFPGLLWGADLRHRVLYLWSLPESGQDWLESLQKYGVQWAFVIIDSPEDLALQNSSVFQLVLEDRRFEYPDSLRVHLYKRVSKERSGS
jgi:hypothetical protein